MAPMARSITDRQQDWLLLLASGMQRIGSPRAPMDWIFGMLYQIRAGFPAEKIFTHGIENL